MIKKIDKKESLKNIFVCNDSEKDKVKKSRKRYKENRKNQSIYGSLDFVYFKVGDIIENINYKNKRYIVIDMHKKTYECLNIDDIKNALYNPVLIKKTDAKRSKNNCIEGIKWLEKNSYFNLKEINNNEVLNKIYSMQSEYIKSTQVNTLLYDDNKTSNENGSSDCIEINSIVKRDGFSDEVFIVKDMLGDMLVCISCTESGRTNPTKHYFNKNKIIIVEDKQKRK